MIRVAAAVAAVLFFLLVLVYAAGRGVFGERDGAGESVAAPRPAAVAERELAGERSSADALGVWRPKQILFGDLHVHTTISLDAFMMNLPLAGGEGAHPPADACDFARFCSALDFWSINDHDFSITPERWSDTVSAIRACNAAAGDPANPDLVSFLGWEWTQVGTTPENHYGHKNVVLRDLEDGKIPAKPISALPPGGATLRTYPRGLLALAFGGRMHDLARYFEELSGVPACDPDVPSPKQPADCMDVAPTPDLLFRKLDEWGDAALVIPHGTTWGLYTPPGSAWDKQLAGAMHDEKRQTLIEVYSGHGDSEPYRSFREVVFDAEGKAQCPEARPDYLPTCQRAGQLIRERCLAAGEDEEECEERAAEARANAAAAGVAAHLTVPGAKAEDWLDAGQCRDCREPAFNYRPRSSVQYIEALGFDGGLAPRRFRFGFIASSDNHSARPGTGYKEVHRVSMTESKRRGGGVGGFLGREADAAEPRSRAVERRVGFDVFESERQASFFTTGGLVAAHATGRDRGAIWDALVRKEVYGTTGPRILLWFDLLNAPNARGRPLPMGSETRMGEAPIFQVRAAGSFEQQPGCPDHAEEALGAADLERICRGECYHPSDRRRRITRIEIVRIQPQAKPGEDVAPLIQDPWRRFDCQPDPAGCVAAFTDTDFAAQARDTLYYARVFEEPALGVNAGNLRCERDAKGECTKVELCPGADGDADDCLAPREPRAWSSPIYVDFVRLRLTARPPAAGLRATPEASTSPAAE